MNPLNQISVLIVDDNPLFRSIATEFLLDFEGIGPVSAADGGESAISKAEEMKPQVILLDLNMPGMNGWETIPHLRQALPEVGIIILTHRPLEVYYRAALEAGADDIVSKMSMDIDLLPVIRRVAAGRQTATNDR